MFGSKTAPRLPTSSFRTGTITPFTVILGMDIFARGMGYGVWGFEKVMKIIGGGASESAN